MKKNYQIFFFLLLSCLALVQAPKARALDTKWVPVDRDEAIQLSKGITKAKYPNADIVVVNQKRWVKYREDGTYIEIFESYEKILTEKGRRSLNVISSYFTIPYNTTGFTKVEIIKPSGRSIPIDIKSNSSITTSHSQMRENIYNPNRKVLNVTVSGLEIGDTLHFIIKDHFTKALLPGTWSDYVALQGVNPIKRFTYTIVAPRAMPLKKISLKDVVKDTVTYKRKREDRAIVYTWVARDVPQVFPEPDMPPVYTVAQRVLVSTISDWKWISRWYWNLCKPSLASITPDMKKKVQDMVMGVKDRQKRMEAVFYWVSHEIRYLGITVEKKAPGYEPHPVSMTFHNRAGVCRDKAALLVAMLRLAGFDAYPVLIMVGPKKDPEVPQPFFNHAIACVRKKDGSYILMDPTDESTKVFFPAYLGNKSYLVATPDGEVLRLSPVQPADKNMMVIRTSAELGQGNDLLVTCTLVFGGINDNMYRGYFSRLTPDELNAFWEKLVKKMASGARLRHYTITPRNMLDTEKPLKVELYMEVKDALIRGHDVIMVPVMDWGDNVGMLHYLTGKMGLEKRKYPYVTQYTCGVRQEYVLKLGKAFKNSVYLPPSYNVENRGESWVRKVTLRHGVLNIEDVFKMNLSEYSPKDYLVLKDTLKKIEKSKREVPIFGLNGTRGIQEGVAWYMKFHPDAVILEEKDEIDVIDAHSWTETRHMKMKILTYAGMKDNSDIYIEYNPIWEKVRVVKACVISPSGNSVSYRPEDINEMDAPWVGDAPRYPSGKILVLSLPSVAVGSTIDYTITVERKNQPFFSANNMFMYQDLMLGKVRSVVGHARFSVNTCLNSYYPIVDRVITFRVPDGLHISISDPGSNVVLRDPSHKEDSLADLTRKVIKKGSSRVFEFHLRHVRPVKREDYMPPWYSFEPMVLASGGSWRSYSSDLFNVLVNASLKHNLTVEKARDLTRGMSADMDKIQAIRDFVAKAIHSIDVPIFNLPMDCISSADRTLRDGYGNSTDIAVLLYTMLKAVGFKPEFVLASPINYEGRFIVPIRAYPNPVWFSVVLVRVRTSKGYVYLNDTDQYAPLGSTPSDGHLGLDLARGDIFEIKALSPELRDSEDVRINITLRDNGDVIMKKTRKTYGMDFALFKKRFSEITPEDRKRHLQELVSRISKGARPIGRYITNYYVYPGIEEFSVSIKGYAVREGGYMYLELPGMVKRFAGLERGSRYNPVYRSWRVKRHIVVSVKLPTCLGPVEIKPPESLEIKVKNAGTVKFFSTVTKGKERVLLVREDINLRPFFVLPSEYPKIAESLRQITRLGSRVFLAKVKQTSLDAHRCYLGGGRTIHGLYTCIEGPGLAE